MSKPYQSLLDDLRRDEGFRRKPYLCSAGYLTIGYGWNLEAHPVPYNQLVRFVKQGINRREADLNLIDHLNDCIADAGRHFAWYSALAKADPVRRDVILNMLFNLGINRFLGFRNTLKALARGDYSTAAKEMQDSKWYRQVKGRAVRLVAMMETGKREH